MQLQVKFIYSEKATKFCEIFPLLLSVCTVDKVRGIFRKILWPSQNIRTLQIVGEYKSYTVMPDPGGGGNFWHNS